MPTKGQNLEPSVTVPARDEAARLPKLIAGLGRQSWISATGRRLNVIIVVNNSTDGSAQIAREAARDWPGLNLSVHDIAFAPEDAHVGSARRLGMEEALKSFSDIGLGVILTTDADAVPDTAWVENNIAALAAGADVVGGLLTGDADEEQHLGPRVLRRAALRKSFDHLADQLTGMIDPIAYDPFPRHTDHTGGSLAVRAAAYAAVGGLPAIPSQEDLVLVSRLRRAGYRLRHCPEVRVTVSARLTGRADGGMAACLRQWLEAEETGQPLMVEDPETIIARAFHRRQLRLWPAAAQAAVQIGSAPDVSMLDSSALLMSPEGRVEHYAPDPHDVPGSIPAKVAIAQLEFLITTWEETGRAA